MTTLHIPPWEVTQCKQYTPAMTNESEHVVYRIITFVNCSFQCLTYGSNSTSMFTHNEMENKEKLVAEKQS